MSDCVVVQPIAEAGIDLLDRAGLSVHVAAEPTLEALGGPLRDARAVITRNWGFPAEAIALAPHLEVIASHGTGVDAIDKKAAAARGIRVVNTPGTNTRAVAEHAFGLILACAKAIPAADRAMHRDDFAFRAGCRPVELAGRTLGLVGFGRIARLVAGYGQAFGMSVAATSSHAADAEMAAAGVTPLRDLDTLCTVSDVISLHGLPTPMPLFDAARLRRLKPGTILVNTARGALIDEAALADSLRKGWLTAAALDVFATEPPPADSPLLDCPNLVLTPHIGGSAVEALDRTGLAVAERVLQELGIALPPGAG